MYEHLWAGVDRKLEEVLHYYLEMAKALQPPEISQWNAALMATGADLDTRWQDRLYSSVSTFLTKVRSVPWIIESCFGSDRRIKEVRDWLDGLTADEQQRRQTFSNQFEPVWTPLRDHYLTAERDASEHRRGFADIEGRVVSPFGEVYIARPDVRIPTAECWPPEPNIEGDPALMLAAAQRQRPIRPRWDQFTIGGKPLFDECRAYLQLASGIRSQAQVICDAEHGGKHLSTPPAS